MLTKCDKKTMYKEIYNTTNFADFNFLYLEFLTTIYYFIY